MNGMNELYRWNAWFDAQSPNFRFDLAIWSLAALGLLNLLFTVAFGMAFGLLVLVGLVLANIARLPYALGELPTPTTARDPQGTERLHAWHRRITDAPDDVVSLPTLGIALAATFGMGSLAALSSRAGPAFGILFILAVVNALVVIRGRVPAQRQPTAMSLEKQQRQTSPV